MKNWFFQLLARACFWRMLFSIQILIKNIEKLIFPAFGKILVLLNVFFYSNSNWKSIEKLIFAAFGKILVLVNAFFYCNSNLKSIEKLIFPAFGKILALANAFFYLNSKSKKYWAIDFSSFLARSWFWWMLFSIEILI